MNLVSPTSFTRKFITSPATQGESWFPQSLPQSPDSQMEVYALWECVIIKGSLRVEETGAFVGPHRQVLNTPCGHLGFRLLPDVCSACSLNPPLREQCGN